MTRSKIQFASLQSEEREEKRNAKRKKQQQGSTRRAWTKQAQGKERTGQLTQTSIQARQLHKARDGGGKTANEAQQTTRKRQRWQQQRREKRKKEDQEGGMLAEKALLSTRRPAEKTEARHRISPEQAIDQGGCEARLGRELCPRVPPASSFFPIEPMEAPTARQTASFRIRPSSNSCCWPPAPLRSHISAQDVSLFCISKPAREAAEQHHIAVLAVALLLLLQSRT